MVCPLGFDVCTLILILSHLLPLAKVVSHVHNQRNLNFWDVSGVQMISTPGDCALICSFEQERVLRSSHLLLIYLFSMQVNKRAHLHLLTLTITFINSSQYWFIFLRRSVSIPSHRFQLILGDPQALPSQKWDIISPVGLRSLSSGTCLIQLQRELTRGQPCRVPKPSVPSPVWLQQRISGM